MLRRNSLGILLVFIVSLTGCAGTMVKPTPTAMKSNGVAVYMIQYMPYPMGLLPMIDGKTVSTSDPGWETQYMVLPPGPHTLTGFQATTSQDNITSTTYVTTTYPEHRKFNIERGKVTSLGVIAVEKQNAKRFWTLWANRQTRILADINNDYPYLLPAGSQLLIAKGNYLNAKGIKNYQGHVISERYAQESRFHPAFVGGPFGALAWMSYGRSPSFHQIRTDSLADFTGCERLARAKLACMIGNGTMFIADHYSGHYYKLPSGVKWDEFHVRATNRIIALSDRFGIAMSNDGGKTWRKVTRFMIKPSFFAGGDTNFYRGRDGVFVYSRGKDHTIVYLANDSDRLQKIPLKWDVSTYAGLLQTKAGLYVGPEYTAFDKASLMFTPDLGRHWQALKIPDARCKPLKVGPHGVLQDSCKHGLWQSADGGRRWSK